MTFGIEKYSFIKKCNNWILPKFPILFVQEQIFSNAKFFNFSLYDPKNPKSWPRQIISFQNFTVMYMYLIYISSGKDIFLDCWVLVFFACYYCCNTNVKSHWQFSSLTRIWLTWRYPYATSMCVCGSRAHVLVLSLQIYFVHFREYQKS